MLYAATRSNPNPIRSLSPTRTAHRPPPALLPPVRALRRRRALPRVLARPVDPPFSCALLACTLRTIAGHGSGGFDGEQGAFNRSHNSGSGAGGVTRDFWGSSGPSPFGSGAGSSSYPNPHLGFDGLDINAGEEWAPEDVDHYAEHLRGSRDLMPPPVRAPSVGGSRRPLFRPPRQAPSTEPSAEDGFGGRLSPDGGSNPRSARTPSRGRGRGHRAHASAGKVQNTLPHLYKCCMLYCIISSMLTVRG